MVKKPYAQINTRIDPERKRELQHKMLEHSLSFQDLTRAAYVLITSDNATYINLVKEAKLAKNISL